MTEQEPDYLIYDNREFIIIDIEYGKQPQAEFVQIPADIMVSTANRRGYLAEYRVEDKQLFGHQIFNDGVSPDTPLHFTGSMVIALNSDKFWITDFLPCYLDADEAYELSFADGMLTEIRNLADAIAEFRTIQESAWWTADLISPAERRTALDAFCRSHLACSYGAVTYRWQSSCRPADDAIAFREVQEKKRAREEDCVWAGRLCGYLPQLRELKGNFLMKNPDATDVYSAELPKDKEAARKCREFFDLCYHSPFWDYEYQIHQKPLLSYYPKITDALPHADRQEICALLTHALRTDYWCEGAFEDQIEDGTYIPLLENLNRIIDETYHPWKKTDFRTGDARFTGMKNWDLDETLPPDEPDDFFTTEIRPHMGRVLRIIDETYIAGHTFIKMNRDEYEKRFSENKPLSLVLEPENQFDKKAVRIEDTEHVKLGYLPKSLNDIPYRLLYGGYELYAFPLVIGSETKGQEYRICVYMEPANRE